MFLIKLVLVGDGAVGKTALKERYLGKGFTSNYLMTIGADFAVKDITLDSKNAKFQIWDLAGQERFNTVRSLYYSGAHGAVLVFDTTRAESFANTEKWCLELRKNLRTNKPIPMVLLGNKIDLRDPNNPTHITTEMGEKITEKLSNILQNDNVEVIYLETSAKTGENVNHAFHLLAEKILS